MNICMIGYGNMGKALCQGLLSNPNYHIHIAAPSLQIGQPQPRLTTYSSNVSCLANANMLILAVKPNQMAAVITELVPHLSPTVLIVSVAAGLDLAWFAQHLPQGTPVVRAMPNIAAACSQSATPLLANSWATSEQRAAATALFQQCGQTAWIQHEKDLDTITALSGSGLAYLFLFAQAMAEAAIALGLTPETANRFAMQTLAGAGSLAAQSGQSLVGLQQKVTSKGGTTAAALDVFAQQHITHIVLTAMKAAVTRSETLRNEGT